MDYACFYRRSVSATRIVNEIPFFDIFVSAFNSSDRVRVVFDQIRANKKIWLIHPEYGYLPLEEPSGGEVVRPLNLDEVGQVNSLISAMGDLTNKTLCIDVTGFMRHVLAFLIVKLAYLGLREFQAVYSEPQYYMKHEDTHFTTTTSGTVRPVRGMAGSNSSTSRDYLLLGVGFDNRLVNEVASTHDNAVVFPIFAFPSLSPDMYQQSVIRAAESGEVALSNDWRTNRRFAPANDPFATAAVIQEIVRDIDRKEVGANIYLSPLATKVQVLGFTIFWILEGRARSRVSLILPECVTYARETSSGINRLWVYTVEMF
ncbi:hypothetical protein SAMN05216403_106106 [Nitrosospira multiformis ATCC 25196]|nr:hypothetical protein SAMN05216403_106106 [Nitrosospira multiformis ATCC 25196]